MRFEGLRTRAAKLAAAAHALKRQSGGVAPFSLAFATDAARARDPELIARALPPGAAIILRDYAASGRSALARRLAVITKARGVLFLVGADAALARSVGADGVHLPSWVNPSDALIMCANAPIITCACHNRDDLTRAAKLGANAAFVSPVFETASHPGLAGLGAAGFRRLAATARLPVLALGGVDERNAVSLAGRNVSGFASIGAFLAR